MSRLETARMARNSTSWLMLLLCTALVAWRVDFHIEQYQLPSVSIPAIAFFDANERNLSTRYESSPSPDLFTERCGLILVVDGLTSARSQLTKSNQSLPETPPMLSRVADVSVPLLPHPPPASLA